MTNKGNQLFRKEALERLSSPERLDQLMEVVSPKAWLPLATIGCLVVVASIWSVVGRIPLTVSGQGVLIRPRRVVPFQISGAGKVLTLNIQAGDRVKRGDVLGTVDQPDLRQQLQQERAKLAVLLKQKQDSEQLQNQGTVLGRATLQQQQASLEESLRNAKILVPILRDKTFVAIEKNRQTLQQSLRNALDIEPILREKTIKALDKNREGLDQQLQQIRQLLPKLEERIEARRLLRKERAISADTLLDAERDYFNSLGQLSNLEAQIKQIDVQKTDAQRQYLQSLNTIGEIKSKLQQLDVDQASARREYLQNLNSISEIEGKLKDIETQKSKLTQQTVETTFNKNNQIQEVTSRIAQLEQQVANQGKIISPYDGRVLEVAIVPGQIINAGTRIGSIDTENPDAPLVSVIYLGDKDGKQIKPGMTLQVTPSIVKRERFGGIVGTVTDVSPFPVTTQNVAAIIGNEELANSFTKNGPPMQIFAQLQKDPTTASGYQWSSSKGPPLKLSPGTTTIVRIKVGERAPISYVVPILRSVTGLD